MNAGYHILYKSKRVVGNIKVAKLKGVLKIHKNFNYKEELGNILLERYNKLK